MHDLSSYNNRPLPDLQLLHNKRVCSLGLEQKSWTKGVSYIRLDVNVVTKTSLYVKLDGASFSARARPRSSTSSYTNRPPKSKKRPFFGSKSWTKGVSYITLDVNVVKCIYSYVELDGASFRVRR